jgi:hypothetical protein
MVMRRSRLNSLELTLKGPDCVLPLRLLMHWREMGCAVEGVWFQSEDGNTLCLRRTKLARQSRRWPKWVPLFVLPQCLHLQMLLETLHNSANGLWPEETHTLSSAVVNNMLPLPQRKHSRHEVAGAFKALLNWLESAGAVGLKPQVRLRSCVSRSASIFLDTLPMPAPLTISDAAFARGMQCHLGLLQMSPVALVVSHDSSEQPTPPPADHAKICNPCTKGRDNVPRLAPPSLAPHYPSCWGCNCH